MAQNDINQKLKDGIEAVRSGDRTTGRRLLTEVIEADRQNETAWLWLASTMPTVRERQACLQQVLRINPNNTRAREALNRLGSEQPARSGSGLDILNIVMVLVVAIGIVGTLFVVSELTEEEPLPPPPTPTQFIPTQPPPTVPSPTRVVNLFDGTSLAPTLPPTFTPTPSPTPTITPTPTATSYPLEEFLVLYTSLQPGAVEPDLFSMVGDGSFPVQVAERFDDITFDPSGRLIAFVRNVVYEEPGENGEPAGTFPELFTTTMQNPVDDAVQLTFMRTTVVASPTWSPEGRELVFVSNIGGDEELWYITPDGENLRQLTNYEFTDRDPAWSPVVGSKRIVFASDRDSFGSTEIYAFELPPVDEEPEFEAMTADNRSSYAPAWSHDGSLITFISDRTGDPDIHIMNADGANPRLLTADDSGAEDRRPVFLPDNRFIAFISNRLDDRFQSYLISIDGSVLSRLTNSPGNDTSIVYQPVLVLRLQEPGG